MHLWDENITIFLGGLNVILKHLVVASSHIERFLIPIELIMERLYSDMSRITPRIAKYIFDTKWAPIS